MITRMSFNNVFYATIVLVNFIIYYFICIMGYDFLTDYRFHSMLSFIPIMVALYCMAYPAPLKYQYWIKFIILCFTGSSLLMLL